MDKYLVNAAIQLIPLTEKDEAYSIVDNAIDIIKSSKLKFTVCPFETIVEGHYNDIIQLIGRIKDLTKDYGDKEFILNLKLQFGNNKDSTINEKMAKY